MTLQNRLQSISAEKTDISAESPDRSEIAGFLLQQFGARAVAFLCRPRTLPDGKVVPSRISSSDAYAALEEACFKMARVALRSLQNNSALQMVPLHTAVTHIFPDPAAYLARAVRSVISDAGRTERREPAAVSLDQMIGAERSLSLKDMLTDPEEERRPEEALVLKTEKQRFRNALAQAFERLSPNYRDALLSDMERETAREEGGAVAAETDRERQTVCRARTSLAKLLAEECGPDNSYVLMLQKKQAPRPAKHATPDWNAERQNALFERLKHMPAAISADDAPEAAVNELNTALAAPAPSPAMRSAVRVLDTYTLHDRPRSENPEADMLYEQARSQRAASRLEKAIELYSAAFAADNSFWAARNEAGVLLIQTGHLREALLTLMPIVQSTNSGEERYIAATNIADIYLTWYDSGRNREHNIERAAHFAKLAMQRPTPMRAVNLILAYVKDRYYVEAEELLLQLIAHNAPACSADKLMQTLARIRDAELISWWNWLDSETKKDDES